MSTTTSGTNIVPVLAKRLDTDEGRALEFGAGVWNALHATVVDGRRVVVPGIGSFELAFGGFSCTIDDDLRGSLHGGDNERPTLDGDTLEVPDELIERLGDEGLDAAVATLDTLADVLWSTGSAMIAGAVVVTAGLRSHPLLPNAPGTPQIEIKNL